MPAMKEPTPLNERLGAGPIEFTTDARVHASLDRVWDAVTKSEHTKAYFGMAPMGDLVEPGTYVIEWEGIDPDLIVIKDAAPKSRIDFEWNAWKEPYRTSAMFLFEEDGEHVKFSVSEKGWELTEAGVKSALANCEGWTQFCLRLKMYLEHGIKSDINHAG